MATVQTITLVINTNESANTADSALNFKANDPAQNLQNLINWLTGIAGGTYGNIYVTATLANNTQVVWGYPYLTAVVSATPTLSVTPTITITASATPTLTPTPTLTITPTPTR
jgi:hypothetical protein